MHFGDFGWRWYVAHFCVVLLYFFLVFSNVVSSAFSWVQGRYAGIGINRAILWTVFVEMIPLEDNTNAPRHFCLTSYFTAPSKGPNISSITPIGTTTLEVKWTKVALEYLHGELRKYVVKYKSEKKENSSVVDPPVESVNLTGLEQNTEYDISVLAVTIENGKDGPTKTGTTGSEYKSLSVNLWVRCLIFNGSSTSFFTLSLSPFQVASFHLVATTEIPTLTLWENRCPRNNVASHLVQTKEHPKNAFQRT